MLRTGLASKIASMGLLSIGMLSIGMGLSGCNAAQEEVKVAPLPEREAAKQTVLRDKVEAMDRARAVEDIAARHQQQLEQAEQQAEGR